MAVTKIQYISDTLPEIIRQLPSWFPNGYVFTGDLQVVSGSRWRIRLELENPVRHVTAFEIVVAEYREAQQRVNDLLAQGYQPIGDSKVNGNNVVQFMGKIA